MNAAARLISQSTVSRTWVLPVLLSKLDFSLIILMIALLMSSLSIVYVTNTNRGYQSTLQKSLEERDRLHMEWGQLLLEKSTWIMQARMEHIAGETLGMVAPDNNSLVIINK